MKKLLGLFLIVFVVELGSAQAAIVFEDNFDSGTMSPEWVSMRPLQWVQNGWLHTQSDSSVPGRNSDAIVHDGDTTWMDYTFSLTVDPLLTSSWENAFVYFRMSNTAIATNGIWFDGYSLHFWGPASATGPSLSLFHCNLGEPQSTHPLFVTTDLPTTSDPWDVVITAIGPEIKVWLDGLLVIDVVDPDPHLHGGIGIGAVWEAEARFDNVQVDTIPLPPTILLLSSGFIALVGFRRKFRKN